MPDFFFKRFQAPGDMVYLPIMPKEKIKLLIVEDEPDICTSVQSYFGKRGFSVSTTASGQEALSMIKISRPDLVLLDISLHDLSGVEVLKELRRHDQQTKVIIITGQLYRPEEVQKIFDLGISDYRNKPLVLEEIAKVVYKITGKNPSQPRLSKKKEKTFLPATSGIVHQLSNLLGIIRNKCENFTLNVEDGIYENKTSDELVNMSVEIMKEIQETVDKTMEVVGQIREKNKK